jgi:uncharacterized membrane protein (GlpM family)
MIAGKDDRMQFVIKLLISVAVIVLCAQVARWRPHLGGLISVMPLTGLLAMLWVYSDCGGDAVKMTAYVQGALWGIVPAILFFIAAYLGFRYCLPLCWILGISFGVWIMGAAVHQWVLR